MKEEYTQEWQQYLDGIDYKQRINLYETVNKNERFYIGDQWQGVKSNGLPTPVFNIFKRSINYFIASIMSQNTAVQYTPEIVGDEPETEEEQSIQDAARLATSYSKVLQEKGKMNQKRRQLLLDAAISGDMIAYKYWDPNIDTGLPNKGDICTEILDNVDVFFGNPNNREVQGQPYIIIAFREMVQDLRKEAERYGIPQAQIERISSDTDTDYRSGDRAKIELDNQSDQSGKCTSLLKLWKQDGKVYARKSTRYTEIRPKWDTKLSLYPVAFGNWDVRKNSFHGQAVGTGLIPNQIFINKMFAMAMMSQMHTAFPKAIYDKTLISAWNNGVGQAIGIEGASNGVGQAAMYLQPGNMSNQAFKLIDSVIQYTKDFLGATDAALGQVKPENTSAIIAIQQASAIPLESIKQNLYQMEEDLAAIDLDFMENYYGKRKVEVREMGKRVIREFDFSALKKMKFRIKIDVGPSAYWSQIAAMQTLDALLQNDRITFKQYLERIPSGTVPQSEELIEELDQADLRQQFIWEQMARYLESLPPEMQTAIGELEPEEQEARLMEMMMNPEVAQEQVNEQQAIAENEARQEAEKQERDFQQKTALKAMEIEGKLALERVKNRKE